MQSISSVSAFSDLLNSNRNVIVDFYADWCGPCKVIAPVIEGYAAAKPHITFVKVNVDEAQELTAKYGVTDIPTFMGFVNGSKVGEVRGGNKSEIEKMMAGMN